MTAHPGGVLAGVRLGPRVIAKLAHDAGFRDDSLFMAVAICAGESDFYTKARNDNLGPDGTVVSRDVGLWQINIPAAQIGTQAETSLYDPATNASAAFSLWQRRGWEPWVAFTSNAYLNDTYIGWAMLGVMNRWGEIAHTAATAAGRTSSLRVPFVSIPDLRKLYPFVDWG